MSKFQFLQMLIWEIFFLVIFLVTRMEKLFTFKNSLWSAKNLTSWLILLPCMIVDRWSLGIYYLLNINKICQNFNFFKCWFEKCFSNENSFEVMISSMEQLTLKNVNNGLISNIYSYLETSVGQSYYLFLNVVHFFNTSLN